MRIPVVLSTVHVDVGADGGLRVDVDGQPHAEDPRRSRSELRSVLDEITTQIGTAVRVEVREHDGTTYADIATPPDAPEAPDDKPLNGARPPTPSAGLKGTGFRPGEKVAVAYVLCTQTADADGRTTVQLPPAILPRHGHKMVLIGMTSAAVAQIEQPA
jgi:hypothetical protein